MASLLWRARLPSEEILRLRGRWRRHRHWRRLATGKHRGSGMAGDWPCWQLRVDKLDFNGCNPGARNPRSSVRNMQKQAGGEACAVARIVTSFSRSSGDSLGPNEGRRELGRARAGSSL